MSILDVLRPRQPEPTPTLPLDDLFDLLSSIRRRRTIRIVDRGGPTDVGELAETIACLEQDVSEPTQLTTQQRKRVYVSLYQTHLHRLDEAGLVEWNMEAGRVEPGPHARETVDLLDRLGNGGSAP